MMSLEAIAIEKLKTLSPERQQEVLDFIEFLQSKDQAPNASSDPAIQVPTAQSDWKSDPFFGLWRDREDLQDSVAWVRQIRQEHWNH